MYSTACDLAVLPLVHAVYPGFNVKSHKYLRISHEWNMYGNNTLILPTYRILDALKGQLKIKLIVYLCLVIASTSTEKTLFWTQCSARLLALYRLIYELRPPFYFLLYWSVKLAFLSKLQSWRRHSLTIYRWTPPH